MWQRDEKLETTERERRAILRHEYTTDFYVLPTHERRAGWDDYDRNRTLARYTVRDASGHRAPHCAGGTSRHDQHLRIALNAVLHDRGSDVARLDHIDRDVPTTAYAHGGDEVGELRNHALGRGVDDSYDAQVGVREVRHCHRDRDRTCILIGAVDRCYDGSWRVSAGVAHADLPVVVARLGAIQ